MTFPAFQGPENASQYQNIEFYRKGGMGEIYLSDDVINNKKVAIKIIAIENQEELKLLENETKISLTLNNENIVRTFYANSLKLSAIDFFYQVMEYHEKGNLRSLIKNQKNHLPLRECIKIMQNLSNGLLYAHDHIIHRDLKPENILLGNDGLLKLCDFGLAKYVDSKTRTHSFKGSGTFPYMAPECWILDANTIAMDIYSLGIIFFEILTNRLPFNGRNENEIRDKHLYEALPSILTLRSEIPIRIVQLISKMTNKRPIDRYKSMKEVLEVLNEVDFQLEDMPTKNDTLLKLANEKIASSKKKELDESKKNNESENKEKLLDFLIESLFSRFISRIDELNRELEEVKIQIQKGKRNLYISFSGRQLQFSFFPDSDITAYIKRRYAASKDFQIKNHGFLIQEIEKSFLEKDNIILIGKVETGHGDSKNKWGYNLILRKTDEEDLYGEWSLAWFNDSPLISKYPLAEHYSLNIPEFYQEYEFGRSNTTHIRNMVYRLLTNEEIDSTLARLFE